MGLDMKTKKKLTEETAKRYCTAAKKKKTKIIDKFTTTTGYNRKYVVYVLKNSVQIRITSFNNVRRESVHTVHRQRMKRVYVPSCGSSVRAEISRNLLRGISTTRPAKQVLFLPNCTTAAASRKLQIKPSVIFS
jgi:hypothetical protein